MTRTIASLVLVALVCCASGLATDHPAAAPMAMNTATPIATPTRAQTILELWHNADDPTVLVVAHRGVHAGERSGRRYNDRTTLPENSIASIEAAIAIGCDMIEVDVRRTKDGRFVLLHDTTLDRTTTGSGRVDEATLADLAKLRLLDIDGVHTEHRIPTLEAALEACRGRILINLDKTGRHTAACLAIAERMGVADHVVLKGRPREMPLGDWLADRDLSPLGKTQGQGVASFMPIAAFEANSPAQVEAKLAALLLAGPDAPNWPAIEVCFDGADAGDRLIDAARQATDGRTRFWMNSLWDSISGGRSDDRAVDDPEAVWGWMVDRGVTVIQTDEPHRLLEFLRSRGLRR